MKCFSGSAFPMMVPDERGPNGEGISEGWFDPGMTLRDFFAAAALTGIIASDRASLANPSYEEVASHAYEQADAMVAAREKTNGESQ